MSIKYEIRPATEVDLLNLLINMRPEDARECHAMVGPRFHKMLRLEFRASQEAWYAGFAGDKLLCLFGLGRRLTMLSTEAPVWMLATEHLKDHAAPFARHSIGVVQNFIERNSRIFNFVDERNVLAVKWLKWLGFVIMEPVQFGVKGERFHPFYMERTS